ncbi:Gfo/Idh/MocA family oxidoreductase [Treponema primitia]|uniref:Gfo/Idh/MocA family protein n=1 Tax=Treponema primitia TaxID=88058 RepID=UPI0039804C0B
MINFGVIGTNWISDQFAEAAHLTGKYRLISVFSRTPEKARAFGAKYGAQYFETDLERFAANKELDLVYIASPNSLHFGYAETLIKAGKDLVVEKPAFSNIGETEKIIALAESHKVLVFEAARQIYEKNYTILKEKLQTIGGIRGATLTYMKYSPRYDLVLKGDVPNIFSREFSGGAMADLGVYPIYSAIYLFGMPEKTYYFCNKISTGVDGTGLGVFRYPDFDVTLHFGKIADSFLKSEIWGGGKTITMDGMNSIGVIDMYDRETKKVENIAEKIDPNPMLGEAEAFADIIINRSAAAQISWHKYLTELMRQVSAVMTKMRLENGIVFSADK